MVRAEQVGSEKRWSDRKPIELDVDIGFRNHTYLGCKSLDVSLGGMFLKFQRRKFPRDAEVDIVVRLQDKDGIRRGYPFRARVAYANDEGIGLAFKDFKVRDFHMLQTMLQLGEAGNISDITMH